MLAKALEMGLIGAEVHEEALLDADGRVAGEVHALGLVEQSAGVDAQVDDGRDLLVVVLEEDLVQDDEQLADGAEHALDALAAAGLVRGPPQQLLDQGQLQRLPRLHPQQHLAVVVVVRDGLSGGGLTSVVKSCM